MTIFQKMLFVPLLSLVFYTAFLSYSYTEHQKNSRSILAYSSDYIPLLAIANQNSIHFEQIRQIFKDAVLANELAWLDNILPLYKSINANFVKLKQYDQRIDIEHIKNIHHNFEQYYLHADKLARVGILNEGILRNASELIDKVGNFHNITLNDFKNLSERLQLRFKSAVEVSNNDFNQVLVYGAILSFISIIILLMVTLFLSLSTRSSVNAVIQRMKALALGETDFSHRLERKQRDELGYLIHWFNKLSAKLEENHLELKKLSITDKLTQLNNRNRTDVFFPLAIQKALKNEQPLAVVMLDIDHFKLINDNYGHLTGDDVLITLASILKQQVGEQGFLARWGGEEFIIILSNYSREAAFKHIDDLCKYIAASHFETIDHLTVSFGLSMLRSDDDDASLMKRTDSYLYQAKEHGRNCVKMNDMCE